MFIFDLDGVLADNTHRQHFITESKREEFYNPIEVMKDKVIWPNKTIVECLLNCGYEVRILTARRDNLREVTLNWLRQNQVYYSKLETRPIDDHKIRNHSKWKASVVDIWDKEYKGHPVIAFFDNEDANLQEVAKVIGEDKVFDLGKPKIFTQGPIVPDRAFFNAKEDFIFKLRKLIPVACLAGHSFTEKSWVAGKEDSYCDRCWVLKSMLPF